MARTDSRDRILDAAERLFAERGVQATTLREIGAEARANTGSIYFHFKTKAELVREVFRRRLAPLDAERLARLDASEAAGPEPPSLEIVLSALIDPLVVLAGSGRGGAAFLRLLGRTYQEPDADLFQMLYADHGDTFDRFRAALSRALPELSGEELRLRFHFALASVASTMASEETWRLFAGRRRAGRPEQRLEALMPFLVAGFGAPGRARERGAA